MVTINGRKPITKREKCLCKAEKYRHIYVFYKYSNISFKNIKAWFYRKIYEYCNEKEIKLFYKEGKNSE